MSIVGKILPEDIPENWIDIGGEILLGKFQNNEKLEDFLSNLQGYDKLFIKFLQPDFYKVAVDTGVKPYTMRQEGRDFVLLEAQVGEVHKYTSILEVICNCHDWINEKWFSMQLAIDWEPLVLNSIKIMERGPVENFGGAAPDMDEAFKKLYSSLHPPDPSK